MAKTSLLLGILYLSAIVFASDNLSPLFDKDLETVWEGSGKDSFIVFEPEKCFDTLVFVSTGDRLRNIRAVIVAQTADTPTGWENVHSQAFDCEQHYVAQQVELDSDLCASKVRLHILSCSSNSVAIAELEVGMRIDNSNKRAVQQMSCTQVSDCAKVYVGLVDCVGMVCVKAQCLIDADCNNPLLPICTYAGGTSSPACGAGCGVGGLMNQRCAHIDNFPFCNPDGTCAEAAMGSPEVCETNNDCTTPAAPLCNVATNLCTGCTNNEQCWKFLDALACVAGACAPAQCYYDSDCAVNAAMPDPKCDPTTLTCTTGCTADTDCTLVAFSRECVAGLCSVPACTINLDCTNPANGLCTVNAAPAANLCSPCMVDDDCAHFSPAFLCSAGVCVAPKAFYAQGGSVACINDYDCNNPALPTCLMESCVAMCDQTDAGVCAQFVNEVWCSKTAPTAGTCYSGCTEDDDCNTDPTIPHCDTVVGSPTQGTCIAGCTGHNSCTQFFSQILCIGTGTTATCQALDYTVNCLTDVDCITPAVGLTCSFDPTNNGPLAALPTCGTVTCASHDDCARFAFTTFCNTMTMKCDTPLCHANSDCPLPTAARCTFPAAGPTGVPGCTTCNGPDQCQQFYTTNYCQSDGNCGAPLCRNSDDCTEAVNYKTPVCSWPAVGMGLKVPGCVVGCTSNTQCSQFVDNVWCNVPPDTAVGTCTVPACLHHADCTSYSTPFCLYPGVEPGGVAPNPNTCAVDADCNNVGTLFCLGGTCSSVRPVCSPSCKSHDDCFHFAMFYPEIGGATSGASFCVTDQTNGLAGQCIVPDCLTHSDCIDPAAPYCDIPAMGGPPSCTAACQNYMPISGFKNDICAKFGQFFRDSITSKNFGYVWCNTVSGQCVVPGCLKNDDCILPAQPFCNTGAASGTPACDVVPSCNALKTACSRFFTNTWCSRLPTTIGTCIVPTCTNNQHCKNPLFPTCSLIPAANQDPACTRTCLNNNDCSQFVHEWYCNINPEEMANFGACLNVCRTNYDCLNPMTPKCIQGQLTVPMGHVKTPFCGACLTNDDCAQFVSEWWCATGTAAMGQCIPPVCYPGKRECTDPLNPMCSTTTGVPACVPGCKTDDDCSRFSYFAFCNSVSGVCYDPLMLPNGCGKSTHCTNALLPVCVRDTMSSTCQATCLTDLDCTNFFQTIYCSTTGPTQGTCVATPTNPATCGKDEDCPNPLLPKCVTQGSVTPTCQAACVIHDTCSHFVAETFCLIGSGICIIPQCYTDDQCPNRLLAYCNTNIGVDGLTQPTCQPCIGHDNCAHFGPSAFCDNVQHCSTPVCDEEDQCTDPLNPICSRNWFEDPTPNVRTCQPGCISNDQCADKFHDYVWCSDKAIPGAGTCIIPVCLKEVDCTNPATPFCDTTGNVPLCTSACVSNDDCSRFWQEVWCVTTPGAANLGQCITPQCVEDEDCLDPANPICVPPDTTNNWSAPQCAPACTSNDDCTRYTEPTQSIYRHKWCVQNMADPRNGQCIQPQCLRNIDCLDPVFPFCDTTASNPPRCVTKCTSNDDCAHFAHEVWCIQDATNPFVGRCIQPECLEDHQCRNPDLPVCDLTADPPVCSAMCLTNDHCTNFGRNVQCIAGKCVAPECFLDAHCTSDILLPACYVPSATAAHPYGWCVECLSNIHCLLRGKMGEETVACDVSKHTCVQCVDNQDCKQAGLRACETARSICVQCVTNADCQTGQTGNLKTCDASTNTCVRCVLDSDCGTDHPACLPAEPGMVSNTYGLCVDCTSDAHCANFPGKHCLATAHQCVQCIKASDCAVGSCDVGSNTCVTCLTDADCTGNANGPACNVATRSCVQCSSNSQCSTNACNMATNLCVECTSDANCATSCDLTSNTCLVCSSDSDCKNSTLPACDRVAGECVPCLYSAHCAAPTPSCSTATRTCVECSVDADCTNGQACDVSANACVGCLDDSYCTNGQFCDLGQQSCVTCIYDHQCPSANPVCNKATPMGECVQCLFDSQCPASLSVCNTTTYTCVECTTSAQCWIAHTNRPICDNNECRACHSDPPECESHFKTYPACDEGDGTCVADAFDKGFYVAAIVLGSIAVFFVALVLGLLAAGVGKKA